jgi:HSP20 family molecular chaperone IbpA
VKKDDMHVSFQGNRLVVSWRTVKITEREEPFDADDLGSGTRILRELEHKKYTRTIPLPDGTKVRLPSHRISISTLRLPRSLAV